MEKSAHEHSIVQNNDFTTEGLLRVNWSIARRFFWKRGPPWRTCPVEICEILRHSQTNDSWSLQREVLHSAA